MGELTANGYPRFSPAERRALEQYVVRYAEPESAYGSALPGSFAAAVVAPLCAEEPTSVLRLARELAAAESVAAWRNLPILLIAVVNGRTDAPAEVHAANAALLDVCRTSAKGVRGLAPPGRARAGRAPARAEWLCFDESFEDDAVSVLLLDAATDPQRFPRKQGVGLARKIGCDVAVALSLAGRLKARYVGAADGDVHLPRGYAEALAEPIDASALVFPFEHVPSGRPEIDLATELVEASWRYYLLGLAWAGSPYAYHSLGSCLAPEVVAYAQARGYPRREAAEDFHLLAKLAKLAPVIALSDPVVRIEARRSRRVPFGTGQAVESLLGADLDVARARLEGFELHDPDVFRALGWLVGELRALALDPSSPALAELARRPLPDELPETARRECVSQLERWRASLAGPLAECPTTEHRLRRTFEAFDALATLQAIHGFRDAGLPPIPWRVAWRKAAFLKRFSPVETSAEALARLREAEAELPRERGPAAQRPR